MSREVKMEEVTILVAIVATAARKGIDAFQIQIKDQPEDLGLAVEAGISKFGNDLIGQLEEASRNQE